MVPRPFQAICRPIRHGLVSLLPPLGDQYHLAFYHRAQDDIRRYATIGIDEQTQTSSLL
jgi:hypothetical protein